MTHRDGKIKRAVKSTTPSKMERNWEPPRRMKLPCLYCEGMVRYETVAHEAMNFTLRPGPYRAFGAHLVRHCSTTCWLLHEEQLDDQHDQRRRFFALEDAKVPSGPQPTFPQEVEARVPVRIAVDWRKGLHSLNDEHEE